MRHRAEACAATAGPALLADVRDQAARADREITDGYERQAVIAAAAYLLRHADLPDEADALLLRNLAKSHSPYYLMTGWPRTRQSAAIRRPRLRWHREAFEKSEGPATRLQWGARYVGALVKFAPHDEAEIGRVAGQLLDEAAAQPNVFYERSARSLRRVSTQLRDWSRNGAHCGRAEQFDAQLQRSARASTPPTASGDLRRALEAEAKKDA
jgi:hypothetical protein